MFFIPQLKAGTANSCPNCRMFFFILCWNSESVVFCVSYREKMSILQCDLLNAGITLCNTRRTRE